MELRTPPRPCGGVRSIAHTAAGLSQVNNSAELHLPLLGAVKDSQELAEGHVPGNAPHAALENPAVRAPVTHAVDVRSANPVAVRRRHAIDARPDPLGAAAAGTAAGRCCGKRVRVTGALGARLGGSGKPVSIRQ